MTLALLMLVSCGTDKAHDSSHALLVDEDGDGQAPYSEGGEDCDDGDATVYTGAAEHCDDRDEDCDLRIDEEPIDPAEIWLDADGDGFGDDDEASTDCTVPSGFADIAGDCDDSDSSVNPGAEEEGFNGVDDDCDASTDDVCGETAPSLTTLTAEALPSYVFSSEVTAPAIEFYVEFEDSDGDLGTGTVLSIWWGEVSAGGADLDLEPGWQTEAEPASSGCGTTRSRNTFHFQVGATDFSTETAYELAVQTVDKGGTASDVGVVEVTTTDD